MSKSPFILAFGLLFFLSCKKGGDDGPDEHNFVKTVTATSQQGTVVQTFTYDDQWRRKEMTGSTGTKFVFEYLQDMNLQKAYGPNGNLVDQTKTYLGANNNNIDSIVYYNEQNQVYQKDVYAYIADSVEVRSYAEQLLMTKQVYGVSADNYYNGQGLLYSNDQNFWSNKTTKTQMGLFKYGLPSEDRLLLDSVVVRYGPGSPNPGSIVTFRYSYVMDSQERIVEKIYTQDNQQYLKEAYTYY